MQDQFNDKLSGRIRDVFENFEDGSADLGWKELRKRFPGKKERNPVAMWWWQSAAVFLLALGTWAYFGRNTEKVYLSSKANSKAPLETPSTPAISKDNTAGTNEPKSGSLTSPLATISSSQSDSPVNSSDSDLRSSKRLLRKYPIKATSSVLAQTNYSNPTAPTTSEEDLAVIAQEEQRVVSTGNPDGSEAQGNAGKSSDINGLEKLIVADMLQKQKANVVAAKPTQTAKLSEEKIQQASASRKSKKVTLGISAGSYMSYAKGSESSINTGVGLLSEIAISKKLKISTGVSLAQNTLKFSTSIPQAAASSFVAAVPAQDAATEKGSFGFINIGSASAVSYSLSRYNASLLGLDLPINLKYSLLKQKREIYVSAGLSSNFFIEENYTYSYQVNSGSNSSTKQEDDNSGKSRFENFDLARMLNVSVGLEQALTKQSRLSFEPFLKYPLGGQGARDIRFGSVGVNLKLNLNK